MNVRKEPHKYNTMTTGERIRVGVWLNANKEDLSGKAGPEIVNAVNNADLNLPFPVKYRHIAPIMEEVGVFVGSGEGVRMSAQLQLTRALDTIARLEAQVDDLTAQTEKLTCALSAVKAVLVEDGVCSKEQLDGYIRNAIMRHRAVSER